MTNVDNSDTTYTNKHKDTKYNVRDMYELAHLHAVWCSFSLLITCHTTLAQVVLESVISSSRHAHVRLFLILFDLSFYFHPHFLVFFLSFFFMHSDPDDLDSVENHLRHSAKGSNDGYDVTFSLTFDEQCLRSPTALSRSST